MSSLNPQFKFREPANRWSYIGVFAAVVLPMSWGLWNIRPYVIHLFTPCDEATSVLCNSTYAFDGFMVPIFVTFILGTLLAGILGLRDVQKSISTLQSDGDILDIGMRRATFAHLIFATLFFVFTFFGMIIRMFFEKDIGILVYSIESFAWMVFFGSVIHLFLWVIITVPLGMICGLIFRLVAIQEIKPSDTLTKTESPTEHA